MTTSLTDDVQVEIGAAVAALMWRRRITQAQMGAAIGVGQSTMNKKLRGQTPITVAELYRAAAFLGVDPADLLPRLDSNQQPSGYLLSQVTLAA